jgi:anti-sigma factor RsiW
MPNCEAIDSLVTPYVDGQLPDADRRLVDDHVRVCAPCHSRVAAERAVRGLIHARKEALTSSCCAPKALHARCAQAASETAGLTVNAAQGTHDAGRQQPRATPRALVAQGFSPAMRSRLAPFAAAASLVAIVGTAFLYQLTQSSSRVMAAELAADHMKCFGVLNPVLHTQHDASTVESSMLSGFGWQMHLPERAAEAGLELVGSRPCLYGEGKIAHIMYRHNGEPVSLFMLPDTERAAELVQVLGHRAAIWCAKNRTFVLVARESKEEVERMASVVQASLQ